MTVKKVVTSATTKSRIKYYSLQYQFIYDKGANE